MIYALFAEAPDQHTFQAYLTSDSALQCVPIPLGDWMRAYAAAYRDLPVRVHHSYVEGGQLGATESFTTEMRRQNFARLTFVAAPYSGTHLGIVPRAEKLH